jgi:hypothetical protein
MFSVVIYNCCCKSYSKNRNNLKIFYSSTQNQIFSFGKVKNKISRNNSYVWSPQ